MTEQNFTPEQLAAWKRLTGAPDAVRSTGKVEDDAALIAPLLPDSLTGPQPALPEPTQDEVDAFTVAWEAERQNIGRGIAPAGQKTRAGLRAAFAEHDRTRMTEEQLVDILRDYHAEQEVGLISRVMALVNGAPR